MKYTDTFLHMNSKGSDMEGKRRDKSVLSTQVSNKRLSENIEAAPAAKRKALEIRVGSPKPSSPKRMGVLSRESSFKSIDKDRWRSGYQTSPSTHDISETARSPSSGIRLQATKSEYLLLSDLCFVLHFTPIFFIVW